MQIMHVKMEASRRRTSYPYPIHTVLMKFKMFTINKGAASAHLLESKSKENIAAI